MSAARGIYTDLAMESGRLNDGGAIEGVRVERDELPGVECVRVSVLDERGAAELGKPVGTYSTVICPALLHKDLEARKYATEMLARELRAMLSDDGVSGDSPTLIIGLGNRKVTPDSLGPRVIGQVLTTRHLFMQLPGEVNGRMGSVCAIDPGVLGVTGIETAELTRGLVAQLKPGRIIAIDALAARQSDRIATTIQLTNTGIRPGSGVGNNRDALTREELHVPVYAIGVPMVVYAHTIVMDALGSLGYTYECETTNVQDALNGTLAEMIVTPREIDELICESATVIAEAINKTLHPQLSEAEFHWLMA